MTTWVIISWVFVAALTAINVVVFLKLRSITKQVMKTAFPGAANMSQALAGIDPQMLQNAMQMFQRMQRGSRK